MPYSTLGMGYAPEISTATFTMSQLKQNVWATLWMSGVHNMQVMKKQAATVVVEDSG